MRQTLGTDSIALCNITSGEYNVHTVQSLVESLRLPEVGWWPWTPAGPYLDDGRNNVLLRALATTTAAVFLFFDSDIIFTPEDTLVVCYEAHRRNAVVGGLYVSNTPRGIEPIAFKERRNPRAADGQDYYRALTKECALDRPHTPLRCDAIGTGFMAMPRRLLEDIRQPMPLPWFSEPVHSGVHFGEDLAFCQLVTSMGYHVYVHRGVRVRHAKTVILDANL